MKIKFLGTAANGGVPQLDCRCGICVAAEKENKLRRLRSSVLVETEGKKIVLDCGPDFRQQMLKEGLRLQDLDLIVANGPETFDGDKIKFSLIDKKGKVKKFPQQTKNQAAQTILDRLVATM